MAGIAILLDLWRKNQNSGLHSAPAFQSSSFFSASAAAASFAVGTSFASRALFGYVMFPFFLYIHPCLCFGDGFAFVVLKGVGIMCIKFADLGYCLWLRVIRYEVYLDGEYLSGFSFVVLFLLFKNNGLLKKVLVCCFVIWFIGIN